MMNNFTDSAFKVTVLMPVYNCADYVGEAIKSILIQSFTDFEFIIIDDASTDETVSIIKGFTDSRIKLIVKPTNTGITKTLNLGLSIAKGEFIARMDGDDISLPDRLNMQITYLEAHPDIAVCGTAYQILNRNEIIRKPELHEQIKITLLKKNCIGHPTVMLRSSILKKNGIKYDETLPVAQDYDLWVRITAYGKLHNLPEVLLLYRKHNNQTSEIKRYLKPAIRAEIRLKLLSYLNYELVEKNSNLLRKIFRRDEILTDKELHTFPGIFEGLSKANEHAFFQKKGFKAYLLSQEKQIYKDYFLKRRVFFPALIVQYNRIQGNSDFKLSFINYFKLVIKSILYYKKPTV
ncbi:Glycosyltransferase involved in cell wall bisynthesis [Bizionia echini]|uniref:Glycosyltransferase involved in cell wall bisynthesis n=1 Tax=Bizionia echini TaxID=649333 RepID=A0A1I5BC47_9FLAO|nr:glycosyltransferase [Bizionia echini]SFN72282.1 Glycosyltransferase involved in cell wall bisynthesis [Bizionia echini]